MDGLGSVSELTRQKTARQANSSDTRIKKYTYDVYGLPTIMSSTGTVRTVSSYNNSYMFTGREYDTETGLYYYRARYYDTALGRFLETDPIGYAGGINLYGYVGNNPWNWTDPWGLVVDLTPGKGETLITPMPDPGPKDIGDQIPDNLGPTDTGADDDPNDWGNQGQQGDPPSEDTDPGYNANRPSGPGPNGPPNSTGSTDDGKGNGTITDYDNQGRGKTDYDFGHDHGQGDPHGHDWDHSGPKPKRGPGRKLSPCE